MDRQLMPLNREWVAPSLIWGEVALCRDPETNELWFCQMKSEAEGWQKLQLADDLIVTSFQNLQMLAGKEPQPSPL